MYKVFYLVYGLTSGGIERVSVNIYKYINKDKVDISMITKYGNREFYDAALEECGGKRSPILNTSVKGLFGKLFFLKKTIRKMKQGYDIAYFCLSKPRDVFKYPILAKILGIKKIIIHSHNSFEDSESLDKRILNKIGRIAIEKICWIKVACSDKASEWMFLNNKNVYIMRNGVEIDDYAFNQEIREQIRKQLGIGENTFVIGHVGRFTKQKNHKFIIDIFNEICKTDDDVILLLVGVGELQDNIMDYVKKLGLNNKVVFLGECKNVSNLMQAFDIFLFPSLYEGLPVVGIEAQAAGLRCFFSNTISTETNITGKIVYLSLADGAEVWAQNVLSTKGLITDRNTSAMIREAGYDIKQSVKELQNIITSKS